MQGGAQLQLAAAEVPGEPKREFDEQVAEFHRCLKLFGQALRPLVIIDSIDQLSNPFQERTQHWRWLPAPEADIGGAVILVSTLPELEYGVLAARLQGEQLSLVSNSLMEMGDVTMLHVRLLHDRTVNWHSLTLSQLFLPQS